MKYFRWTAPIHTILSVKGLSRRALFLLIVFFIFHLAGFRQFTGFLCGTLETGAGMRELSALLGFTFDMGALGIWVAFPLGFVLKAALGIVAYRRGHWARTGVTA